MALISVAELLFDPDFVDQCMVLRQIQTVGDDGMAQTGVVCIPILASIQAASGDSLSLLAEAGRTSGTYDVITAFPLTVATDQHAADIVLWQGEEFTVTSIGRFGNFRTGAGHYEGIMELKPLTRGAGLWDDGATIWQDSPANLMPVAWQEGPVPVVWDYSATSWKDAMQWKDKP